MQQDVEDSGEAEEVKQQEVADEKSQSLSYLTADAMQLLDDIFGDEQEVSRAVSPKAVGPPQRKAREARLGLHSDQPSHEEDAGI